MLTKGLESFAYIKSLGLVSCDEKNFSSLFICYKEKNPPRTRAPVCGLFDGF